MLCLIVKRRFKKTKKVHIISLILSNIRFCCLIFVKWSAFSFVMTQNVTCYQERYIGCKATANLKENTSRKTEYVRFFFLLYLCFWKHISGFSNRQHISKNFSLLLCVTTPFFFFLIFIALCNQANCSFPWIVVVINRLNSSCNKHLMCWVFLQCVCNLYYIYIFGLMLKYICF